MLKKVTIMLSLAFFIASLTQTAFYTGSISPEGAMGTKFLLFFGWLGIFIGDWGSLTWLANPLYILSLYLFLHHYKAGIVTSGLTLLIALMFLKVKSVVTNEAGTSTAIVALAAGYWLWTASFMTLFTGTLLDVLIQKKSAQVASD